MSIYGTGTGIYKIINKLNGKFYIGSASYLKCRKANHFRDLRLNRHDNPRLQNSYNKYGVENFEFLVVENCLKQDLITREQYYIDTLNPFFNIARTAGSNYGFRFSEESKRKMSLAQRGKKLPEEQKIKIQQSAPKIAVVQLDLQGNIIATYNGMREAGRAVNRSHSGIRNAILKNTHSGGFYWKKL